MRHLVNSLLVSRDRHRGLSHAVLTWIGLFVLVLPSAILASGLQPLGRTLDAERLVQQVLLQNRSISAEESVVSALKSSVIQAGSLDDPQLSYSIAPNTLGSSIGDRHIVQLSQTIPWPGIRKLKADMADEEAAIAASDLETVELILTKKARTTWAQWWYVHQAIKLNLASIKLAKTLVPVAETAYGQGLGLQQDVILAQLRLKHLQHQNTLFNEQKVRIQAQINALLGHSPGHPLPEPTELLEKTSDPSRLEVPDSHPQLLKLDRIGQQASRQLELAKLDRKPSFKTHIGYVGTLDPSEKRLQVGVSVNLPFSLDKRREAEASAQYRRESVSAKHEDLVTQLAAKLAEWKSRYSEAHHIVVLYQNSVIPLQKQGLEASKADYEAGRGDYANVNAAEQGLLDARLELARVRANLVIAAAEIDQLTVGQFLAGSGAKK